MGWKRTLARVLGGRADASISFLELCSMLEQLGFRSRSRGSHNIFWKEGISEMINLQKSSGEAKPYQVRQVRKIILKYGLDEERR